jgi:hypothetical protein
LFLGATRPTVTSPPTIKSMYEKFFVFNGNSTDTLSAGYIRKTLDPSGLCAFDIENAVDGTESVANRTTSPSNATGSFDSFDKIVQDGNSPATGTLLAGEAQGVWIRLQVSHLTSAGVGQVNISSDGEGH